MTAFTIERPVPAGRLQYRATLEQPSETSGDATLTYTTKATVWTDYQETGGFERNGIVAEGTVVFLMRYRPDLAIDVRWRVGLVGTNRKFNITAITRNPQTAAMILTTSEVV